MWELNYNESWALKDSCFWTVMVEMTLESPLDSKEIQPVHPKGNQYWIFIGRTNAEAETPIFWPPDVKNWLRVGGEGDNRGWDGWMASWTQWTWVWVNSGSWWWTGRPGILQSMRLQWVGHDWATELFWDHCHLYHWTQRTEVNSYFLLPLPHINEKSILCLYFWLAWVLKAIEWWEKAVVFKMGDKCTCFGNLQNEGLRKWSSFGWGERDGAAVGALVPFRVQDKLISKGKRRGL